MSMCIPVTKIKKETSLLSQNSQLSLIFKIKLRTKVTNYSNGWTFEVTALCILYMYHTIYQ